MKNQKQRTRLACGLGLGTPLLLGLLLAGGPLVGNQPANAFGDLYESSEPQATGTNSYHCASSK